MNKRQFPVHSGPLVGVTVARGYTEPECSVPLVVRARLEALFLPRQGLQPPQGVLCPLSAECPLLSGRGGRQEEPPVLSRVFVTNSP